MPRGELGHLMGTAWGRSNVSDAEEDMQYLPRHYFNLDRAGPYVRARTLRRRRHVYRLPPASYQKQPVSYQKQAA